MATAEFQDKLFIFIKDNLQAGYKVLGSACSDTELATLVTSTHYQGYAEKS